VPTFPSIPPGQIPVSPPPGFYNHPPVVLDDSGEGFRIVARNAILSDCRWTTPLAPVITGTIGRLASTGELWARADSPGWMPFRWTPSHDAREYRLVRAPEPGPWLESTFETGLDFSLPEPAEVAELKLFFQTWPHVAPLLKDLVKPVEAVPLFNLGRARISRLRLSDPPVDWGEFLGRHARGDWGLLGRFDDREISADEAWTLELQPQGMRNNFAVKRNRGRILSQHILSSVPCDSLGRPLLVACCTDVGLRTALRLERAEQPISQQETEPCHE
jgi:hypothetical protein